MQCVSGKGIDMEKRLAIENFTKGSFDLWEQAIKAAGYRVDRGTDSLSFFAEFGRIVIRDGKVDHGDDRNLPHLNKVKRAFSVLVIKTVAKKHGYVVHQVSENKFISRKR